MTSSLRRMLMCLIVALAVAACSSPEQREAEHLERGLALLEEGDLARAAVNLRNVLRINPRNAPALLAMGRINEAQQRYPQAFNFYFSAADSDPTLIEAHNAYAVLALTANQLDLVQDAVTKIRAADPDHPDGLALEAALLLRQGDIDAAETAARAALAARPDHVNATSALAGVFNAREERSQAVALIDEFHAAHGPNVPLALLKIQLLSADGDLRGIEEGFAQLIEFAPDAPEFRIALANFYRSQERNADAETTLRAAIDGLASEVSTAAALVQLVHGTRGLDAAVAEADRLLEREPEARALDFLIADLLAREGRIDAARTRLARVVEAVGASAPTALDATAALAGLDLAEGDRDRAEERLAGVLQADRQHRGANYLTGVLRLAEGDANQAISAGRSALSRDPDWVPGLKLLAEAHYARGERALAAEALGRVTALAPRDVPAAEAFARLLTERGDYDRAMEVWDRIIQQVEDPAGALATTAELAIRQQNWARASRDIDRLLEDDQGALSGALLAGSLRVAQGDYAGGRAWFVRAGEMNPDAPQPLLGVVQSFIAENDVAGALEVLAARVEETRDDALAWNLMAQLHAREGRADAAAEAHDQAIAAQPSWARPYRELAELQERAGRTDLAISTLERGVEAGADPVGLVLQRAFVEQRAERFAAAIDTYERLLDGGNESDLVVNNFAALVADFAYDDPRRMERASTLAARFQSSSEAYFLDTLGWLRYRQGDAAAALPLLRRATALLPADPQLNYHAGVVFHATGDTDQARTHLQRALADDEADFMGRDHALALLEEIERRAADQVRSDSTH
ncbi:MAG: hypothetical protein EA356_13840 [Geminicoccaceae bacterium]|nr:MAG: hypothetical protein EA356_13840 [Geminicoccaceae bacterium]